MGKNKRGGAKAAGGVFKVAGAKSLKKTKSKAVQLGLKNIKKRVEEVDAQFVALSKKPAPKTPAPTSASASKPRVHSAEKKAATSQQIADTMEKLVQMEC